MNHYDIFRKYLCNDCKKVLICKCEKELGSRFLPYQLTEGTEYSTKKRYPVNAFAPNICSSCRGEKEEAHPRAYGGKIERYYWREIYKTYLTVVSEWLINENTQIKDILSFERRYPTQAKRIKKEAIMIWQERHKQEPKYDIIEQTEDDFLIEVKIPEQIISAKYVQIRENKKKIGKWINREGKPCSVEELVADWYRNKGFSVRRCELRLISILIATFCSSIILGSKQSLTHAFLSGFGSSEYFKTKSHDFEELTILKN